MKQSELRLRKGEIVDLSDTEQRLARFLGKERQRRNEKAGLQSDRQDDRQTDVEIHVQGAGAEIAAARLLNVFPDLDTSPRRGSFDLYLDGLRIDVKATSGNALGVRIRKRREECDVFFGLVGNVPQYRYVGYIASDDVYDGDFLVDGKYGRYYRIPLESLHTGPIIVPRLTI